MRIAAKKAHRWTQTVMATEANGYDNLKASNVPKTLTTSAAYFQCESTTFHERDIIHFCPTSFSFSGNSFDPWFAREIGNSKWHENPHNTIFYYLHFVTLFALSFVFRDFLFLFNKLISDACSHLIVFNETHN